MHGLRAKSQVDPPSHSKPRQIITSVTLYAATVELKSPGINTILDVMNALEVHEPTKDEDASAAASRV